MAEVLFDTSVALKWVLKESDSDVALALLKICYERKDTLLYLDIGRAEAANGIVVQERRGLIDINTALDSWTNFENIPLTLLSTQKLMLRAITLSLQHKIAVYDALLIATMIDRDCDTYTADVPLFKKMTAHCPRLYLLANTNYQTP